LSLTKKIGKGWYPYLDLTKALVLKRGIWFRSAIVYMRGRRKKTRIIIINPFMIKMSEERGV
jgi:hypothetical protein